MSEKSLTNQYHQKELELIKATVAKGATNAELELFLYRCRNMGLDPLRPGHIHFVKYGSNPGTIVIGLDGFRYKASKTGLHTGTKRGVIRNEAGECIGAWCEVYRKDWTECAREEVSLHEYNTSKAMWAKMPETMIKKVAEVAALRMAFPDELGGLYSQDEMDQGTKDVEPEPPKMNYEEEIPVDLGAPMPTPEESLFAPDTTDTPYTVGFGKHTGRTLSEIPDLNGYINWLEKQGNPRPQVQELIKLGKDFIKNEMANIGGGR